MLGVRKQRRIMIKFTKIDKRKFQIVDINNEVSTPIADLDLIYTPVANKFDKLVSFVEDCSVKLGPDFDMWYKTMLLQYKANNYDYQIIRNSIPDYKKKNEHDRGKREDKDEFCIRQILPRCV